MQVHYGKGQVFAHSLVGVSLVRVVPGPSAQLSSCRGRRSGLCGGRRTVGPVARLTGSRGRYGASARLGLTVLAKVNAQQHMHLVGLAVLLPRKSHAPWCRVS